VRPPLVLHGTCGVSMEDISRCVKAGMTKINFGEGIRMNYIQYFNELSQTLNHEHHVWRIDRAAKDRLKKDIKEIIQAVGSDGKADEFTNHHTVFSLPPVSDRRSGASSRARTKNRLVTQKR